MKGSGRVNDQILRLQGVTATRSCGWTTKSMMVGAVGFEPTLRRFTEMPENRWFCGLTFAH